MGLDPFHQLPVCRMSVHINEHHVHGIVPVAQGIDLHATHAGDLQGPESVVVLVSAGGRCLQPQDITLIIGLVSLGVIASGERVRIGHRHDTGDLHRHHGDAPGRQVSSRPRRGAADGNLSAAGDVHGGRGGKLDAPGGLKEIPLIDSAVARHLEDAGCAGGRVAHKAGPALDVTLQLLPGKVGGIQLGRCLLQLCLQFLHRDRGRRQQVIGGEPYGFLVAVRHRLQHGFQGLRHPRSPPQSPRRTAPP